MGIIILQKLEAKSRTVLRAGGCVEEKSSAFVGATSDDLCQFGIGLLNEETQKCSFWALVCPHLLITAWRGMHILDRTICIQRGTICHAYYAGETGNESSDVKRAIADLAEQIPEIEELRKEVLEMKIDDETLDAMLKICNDPKNHIDVNSYELKEAIQAGVINQTPEVTRVFELADEKKRQIEHDKEFSEQPLPEAKSFRKFCEKVGICNLYSDPYDDWPCYWNIERLDATLVYDGLQFEGIEEVWCAEHPQGSDKAGHIGQPVLELNDQRTVVLSYVRFKDNDMWGAIHLVKGKNENTWLTLSDLSALNPHFVGLTFDGNDKPKIEDMARGYFAARSTKNPIKKILNAVASV